MQKKALVITDIPASDQGSQEVFWYLKMLYEELKGYLSEKGFPMFLSQHTPISLKECEEYFFVFFLSENFQKEGKIVKKEYPEKQVVFLSVDKNKIKDEVDFLLAIPVDSQEEAMSSFLDKFSI